MKIHRMNRPGRNAAQRGFTLVELLLVLVILALIGGLVLPGIIGKAEGAKAKAAASQVSRLAMAVESFYLDTGTTPDSLGSLLELSWNATRPLKLDDGAERTFIEDGDTLTLGGAADNGQFKVGFGEARGTVLASPAL